ncbi:putative TetR family transcriptional regulator [Gordonia hirsuta DSM 44140 = NBRC 16056]|uniref:Putative TetR family transcriptional regulator n=1 Tax=Gordonia hirsuta DSM 44140 = NBRC 16056 TaxID=1121927 RepID=L7LC69_9ACTN|nr:TetR/AcrR family transcriptional regulator [Gordonia hirsuta]GAC58484.1 putative TetR family transcriptional regulator [Gordonia hirsuta DSM 44140 = NBRC 16056]
MTGPAPEFATRRRGELFDGLVDLFLTEGFAHLTLDEIAARLRCSKSTLYTLADSKDELVRSATIHFFRGAVAAIDERTRDIVGARAQIIGFLEAIGATLAPASDRFMADLDAFTPAREVYEQNTAAAADRVKELVDQGVADGEFRAVHAAFAADLAATMITRIQQRGVRTSTGLDDAEAYRELAAILTGGISK